MLKQIVIRSACNTGAALRAVLGPLRDSTSILMYHRVAEPIGGVPAPSLNVSPRRFARQLQGLQRRGYRFLPLAELLEAAASGDTLPAKTLAVTMDDGYENMHSRVLPIARQLQVPVTVFICTGWLDRDAPMDFDHWGLRHQDEVPAESYRPLRLKQCCELLDSGWFELGAHTHTHSDFRGRPEFFQQDLQQCVDCLRQRLGIESPSFAFPFGRVDEGFATAAMVAAARETGVRCALTTEPGPVDLSESPFHWGRNNVFPWDTAATIDARLSGWYQWLPNFRRWLRQRLRIAGHSLDNRQRQQTDSRHPSMPSNTGDLGALETDARQEVEIRS